MDIESGLDRKNTDNCPVEMTLRLIGSKWKVLILRELLVGTRRFGELSRGVSGISQKMLTQQLRQMEKDRLVNRKVYAQVPPKVEYSLTKKGRSLETVIEAMREWGERYPSHECTSSLSEIHE